MRWRVAGSDWRLAPALVTLARQLDAIWPDRHITDGTVGDRSHQNRTSDHNPNAAGFVTAIDVGETVEGQGQQLVDALVADRDSRVKYIIHEDRIWRSYSYASHHPPVWQSGVYTGRNRHLDHVHLSVSADPSKYLSIRPWRLQLLEGDEHMLTSELIAELQAAAIRAGHDLGNFEPLDSRFPRGADGKMGSKTRAAFTAAFAGAGDHTHVDLDDAQNALSAKFANHRHPAAPPQMRRGHSDV